jgi:transcriptional regulator with XRE-family HTH domain
MTLRRILARNLKRLRKERRLTQEELADLTELNRNHVGMIERQENAASVDTLEALAKPFKSTHSVYRAVGNPRAARWGRR